MVIVIDCLSLLLHILAQSIQCVLEGLGILLQCNDGSHSAIFDLLHASCGLLGDVIDHFLQILGIMRAVAQGAGMLLTLDALHSLGQGFL